MIRPSVPGRSCANSSVSSAKRITTGGVSTAIESWRSFSSSSRSGGKRGSLNAALNALSTTSAINARWAIGEPTQPLSCPPRRSVTETAPGGARAGGGGVDLARGPIGEIVGEMGRADDQGLGAAPGGVEQSRHRLRRGVAGNDRDQLEPAQHRLQERHVNFEGVLLCMRRVE